MLQRHFSPRRLAPLALAAAVLTGTLPAMAAPRSQQDRPPRAQQDRPPRAQQDRPPRADAVDRELAETLERVLILRMQKALELNAEQEDTVVPLMRELTGQRRERARRRMEAMRTLTVMAQDTTVEDRALQDRIDRFYADQTEAIKDEARLLREIRAELTPRQQVRLLHVEEKFRTEIRERLQDVRRQRERARPRTDRPVPGPPPAR